MSTSNKIIITISAIVAICVSAFIIYRQIEISERHKAIETEAVKQKELADNIIRNLNEYATKKDMERFANENGVALSDIKKDLEKLHAEIKSVSVINVYSQGYKKDDQPSTNTGPANPNPQTPTVDCNGEKVPCPNADPYGYMRARKDFNLIEPFNNVQIPIGSVGFSAWKPDPWYANILPRQYRVTSVVGTDENQRQYFYNKFSIIVDGKSYDIHIDEAVTKQEYPTASFHYWNPRLFFGADAGFNLTQSKGEFTPSINFGFLSYGMYKTQPDFSFVELGLGYGSVSNRPMFVITPLTYNVAKHIPLLNNMYLGPSLNLGFNGDFAVMGGLRVAL
jgi:hypothetical protein